MKVLVIGSGGREHALVDALHRSPSCSELVCTPGNPGIAELARCVASDLSTGALEDVVVQEQPDLVVVGPEAPLVAGLADRLRAKGVAVFGPGAAGAQLEGSKWFAKELLVAAGVGTAAGRAFDDPEDAAAWIEQTGAPVVVKDDGLAAGKGVVVAVTVDEAVSAARAARGRVVVEECLEGPELSVLALVSGQQLRLLAPARDHKRAFDGDTGPNTGGMGAVGPPPDADDELLATVRSEVFEPVLAELERRGIDYRGVLYAGLMLTADGPHVIEFNVRFGDPEAQVVLPRLTSDVAQLLHATATGTLDDAPELTWDERACVGIVVAADDYPADPRTGDPITLLGGLDDDQSIFHAGTTVDTAGTLQTSGGRVATAVGFGATLELALDRATAAASTVSFDGAWHRTDIGRSSLDRAPAQLSV